MKFLNVKQRTDEWYQARLGLVTGSRMKDVIAFGKRDGKPLKARSDYLREVVAERLVGEIGKREVYVTPEMLWGQMNEGIARSTYQLQTGNKVGQEGFIRHDTLMCGVSTDGLVNNEGNLEIKCLTTRNHLYEIIKYGTMPEEYKPQVQMQLWITEREWCDFVGYDSRVPSGLDLLVVRVYRDEDYINYLEEETKNFLEEADHDVRHFLRYLPVADRVCHNCGSVFTDKLALCPDCHSNRTEIKNVLQPPELNINQAEGA